MRAPRLGLLAALGSAGLASALAVAGLASAQGTPGEGQIELIVKVGDAASLCPCPVRGIVCDDPSLVRIVDEPAGQSLQGVKPGTTLCGLQAPNGVRRVYRVTVADAGKR